MRTQIIFLSISWVLFSVSIFAQKQSPSNFVQNFYKFHQLNLDPIVEISVYEKWFSDDLNKLLRYELRREKEFLDKNPTFKPYFGDGISFIPSDECFKGEKFIKHVFKTDAVVTKRNKTTVKINFYYPKVCGGNFVDFRQIELIKNKDGWLINDLIYSDGSRLSKDLQREMY